MLDENGSPQIVERAKIVPPRSQVGAITPEQRKQVIDSSVLAGHYEKAIDRESAYEKLLARAEEKTQNAGAAPVVQGEAAPAPPAAPGGGSILEKALGTAESIFKPTIGPRGGVHDTVVTTAMKSVVRAASSSVGREIARGILGSILGGGSGRRR
jgi:hypothetical protein